MQTVHVIITPSTTTLADLGLSTGPSTLWITTRTGDFGPLPGAVEWIGGDVDQKSQQLAALIEHAAYVADALGPQRDGIHEGCAELTISGDDWFLRYSSGEQDGSLSDLLVAAADRVLL